MAHCFRTPVIAKASRNGRRYGVGGKGKKSGVDGRNIPQNGEGKRISSSLAVVSPPMRSNPVAAQAGPGRHLGRRSCTRWIDGPFSRWVSLGVAGPSGLTKSKGAGSRGDGRGADRFLRTRFSHESRGQDPNNGRTPGGSGASAAEPLPTCSKAISILSARTRLEARDPPHIRLSISWARVQGAGTRKGRVQRGRGSTFYGGCSTVSGGARDRNRW